ncbi:MAG TPA: hypothetical protein VMB20_13420 [Candidatus Acidoferrum sp.]|nr:hypothetical protein [Candidatus Acidoferrum sp.]
MRTRIAVLATILALAFGALAHADEPATYNGPESPSELAFVKSMQADLMARFPHASDAEKAGYVRYTSEDDTGAISYANRQWTSDPTHPSQLWYDKDGNLLGADFSVPRPNKEPRPNLWGINPGRWVEFDGHVHWVAQADGKMIYDQYMMNDQWVGIGGSLTNPSAQTLVKVGKVPSASNVVTIFEFPTIWDLIVWVKPNPNGPFADKNPMVTP